MNQLSLFGGEERQTAVPSRPRQRITADEIPAFVEDLTREMIRYWTAKKKMERQGKRSKAMPNISMLAKKYNLDDDGRGWLDVTVGTCILGPSFAPEAERPLMIQQIVEESLKSWRG